MVADMVLVAVLPVLLLFREVSVEARLPRLQRSETVPMATAPVRTARLRPGRDTIGRLLVHTGMASARTPTAATAPCFPTARLLVLLPADRKVPPVTEHRLATPGYCNSRELSTCFSAVLTRLRQLPAPPGGTGAGMDRSAARHPCGHTKDLEAGCQAAVVIGRIEQPLMPVREGTRSGQWGGSDESHGRATGEPWRATRARQWGGSDECPGRATGEQWRATRARR